MAPALVQLAITGDEDDLATDDLGGVSLVSGFAFAP